MLSSKALIVKTGISRATLNNYINLGILSKPTVQTAGGERGGARILGYFPDWSLERIELVRQLKAEGLTMADIAARFGMQGEQFDTDGSGAGGTALPANVHALDAERRVLQLSIDDIPHPAYMVNYSFELAWYNELARQKLLGNFRSLPSRTEARNVFLMLLEGTAGKPSRFRTE